jgi:hypothetical protein
LYGPGSESFHEQATTLRKSLISYIFVLDILLGYTKRQMVHVPTVRSKKKKLGKKDYFLLASQMPLKKRARAGYGSGAGSLNSWYGSVQKIL